MKRRATTGDWLVLLTIVAIVWLFAFWAVCIITGAA